MKRNAWSAFSSFWATDRGLSIFLVLLVVLIFVLPLLRPAGTFGRLAGHVVFSLLLLSGVAAVYQRGLGLVTVSVVAAAALLVRWASWLWPSVVLDEWRTLSVLVSLGLLCLIVLVQVFREGPVTLQRIQGAIAVYLLLGVAWAAAYELVALESPGAFAGAGLDGGPAQPWIYYSFVTLTTVGYGDVTPVHPVARSLAMLEALTGQLYLAILLARLVSLEVQSRGSR